MKEGQTAYTLKDSGGIIDRLRKLVHRKISSRNPHEETNLRREILKAIEKWCAEEEERLNENGR